MFSNSCRLAVLILINPVWLSGVGVGVVVGVVTGVGVGVAINEGVGDGLGVSDGKRVGVGVKVGVLKIVVVGVGLGVDELVATGVGVGTKIICGDGGEDCFGKIMFAGECEGVGEPVLIEIFFTI